ncbi:MAG: T9SS type A sorting domain-containing protein [Lewinellaceae bacterium]|nr:T9SS type A sorting domain-containing protein [Saprospiraceae bacterium]MCB9333668.1 T9SS type A sorting domain-containing protein [Lewinellaceae bacterium]
MSMYKALFLLLFYCCSLSVEAQSFQATPGPLLSQVVKLEQANECYLFFENTSSDSIQLRWKRLDMSFSPEWTVDLCDFGLCYVGIPASGTMSPSSATEQPYLKLIVQPGATPGAAWFWFRVWETGNPAAFEDVYFSLYSPGVTSLSHIEPMQNIQVFPNPATTQLNLENQSRNSTTAQIVDAQGRLVWDGELPGLQRKQIDCSNWSAGPHFLLANNKTYTILRVP